MTRHAHPAWKIVLCDGGATTAQEDGRRAVSAPGLVIPPQHAHTCSTTTGYLAVFVDLWRTGPGRGERVRQLDERSVRRLLDLADADGLREALDPLLGSPPALDPRLAYVLERLDRPSIMTLADDVGLSPSGLRGLVHGAVGIPLVRLRQWHRLRHAVAQLGTVSPAMAANAGHFADQAHFTRLARRLLGRTPGSLRG
ncbi:helix-turn-helix domain-containing protein [Actinomadura sp. 6N118]|uniref:helix-turn-helix domain-containing protein n=1 Tax=Actinomadura sp. 6N118 TaxID=3375151 RepID=UPI00379FA6C4